MGDRYPGPGSTLGPAMTFAWIGMHHALDAYEARSAQDMRS
jgi:hypothetical protein